MGSINTSTRFDNEGAPEASPEAVSDPIPGAINDVVDIPGSMFDPNVVRAAAIRQLKEMEERHNFNRRVWYMGAVSNWVRNHTRFTGTYHVAKKDAPPIPVPPWAIHYRYVEGSAPEVTEGPDRVAQQYNLIVPPGPEQGIAVFGPPVEDGSGAYLAGADNTAAPGDHATGPDGREYVLVQIGKVGTLIYRKIWMPVEEG